MKNALDVLMARGFVDQVSDVDGLRRALEEPIRQIANNAGWEGSVVVQKVKEMSANEGFNADVEQ